jgi:hypothetical protein
MAATLFVWLDNAVQSRLTAPTDQSAGETLMCRKQGNDHSFDTNIS